MGCETMLYYYIVPVRYTYLVVDEPRHLVIAQYLKKYPEMMEFFKRQIGMGHEVILDNGAYEFGKPMDRDEYYKVIEELHPQIVIAPDSWKNDKETISLHDEFKRWKIEKGYDEKGNYNFVTMSVPQGKTIYEYVDCCQEMDITPSDIIGMSVGSWKDVTGIIRPFMVSNLSHYEEPKIHLLGLWNASEITRVKDHKRVRSVDTSMPFKLAKNSEMFTPSSINTEKMDFEMTLTGQQEELAEMNLERMRNFVEGV